MPSVVGTRPDDAWGFTWFDRRSCRQQIEAYRSEGLYTPPSVEGTILMPSSMGGANWGSLAHDPSRRLVVVNTNRVPAIVKLIPREQVPGADTRDDQPAPNEAAINPQRGTPYVVEFEFLVQCEGSLPQEQYFLFLVTAQAVQSAYHRLEFATDIALPRDHHLRKQGANV